MRIRGRGPASPELDPEGFPAELEGRPILLCWQQGEEKVGFWHEAEAGAKGRTAVPEDPNWPPAPVPPTKGKSGKSPKLS